MEFNSLKPTAFQIFNLAKENNCWIRYSKTWYTPDGFVNGFGAVNITPDIDIVIMNPLKALAEGREKIKEMVISGMSPTDICKALDRLYRFEDLIKKKGFYPSSSGQVDKVKIPGLNK